jgi:hypothetical protein
LRQLAHSRKGDGLQSDRTEAELSSISRGLT